MSQTPQLGIFEEGSKHSDWLEYKLKDSTAKADVNAIKNAINKAKQSNDTMVVVSFGKTTWNLLQPQWCPVTLEDFYEVKSEQYRAPSTQADVFFWVQGHDIARVFDQALHIQRQMQTVAKVTLDERGFEYHDSLDLIGFEDGTGNPKTPELIRDAALIAKGQPGAGGCLVMTEKWVHNLDKWNELPLHCQEGCVGRTKIENIELEGEEMPIDSHVSRTDLTIDGVGMKIYRRSAPYGTVKQNGLLFLAFACELKRFTTQLESMYGHNEEGVIDQLLHYSKAVTGSYFFAPTKEDLAEALNVC